MPNYIDRIRNSFYKLLTPVYFGNLPGITVTGNKSKWLKKHPVEYKQWQDYLNKLRTVRVDGEDLKLNIPDENNPKPFEDIYTDDTGKYYRYDDTSGLIEFNPPSGKYRVFNQGNINELNKMYINNMRKFQQGGQMDQQQQALVQFIQGIAQVAQVDPQQVMQLAQQEPQRLETAVQVFQQTQDIQQAAQAFFQKEVQSAKKGAKLNYLKKLANRCPEGTELRFFKAGGHICSKCVAKKQSGDEIEEAKCGSKIKKKKGCGGFKVLKAQLGTIVQMPESLTTELATKRHADIANYYFHEAPTISNLYNGVTNWLKSKMILTPDGTGLVTGTAPMPTRAKNAKEALEMVRAMKAAKAAKSGKSNISTEVDPVKDSWMTDYILRSSKSTLRARAAQARGRKATDIQVRQTTGRGPILYRTGKHTNRGAITTDDIYE